MSVLTDRLLSLLPDLKLHREVDDDSEALIAGSPGTGKTRSLNVIVDAHLKAGIPPDQILINAFTRNATQELRRRLASEYGLTDNEMTWVRTIHSSCFRLLQLRPEQTVGGHLLKEFGEESGYKFQGVLNQRSLDDPYSVGSIQTFGDWCYVAEELRRALTLTIPEIVTKLRRKNPTDTQWGEDEATQFLAAYTDFKHQNQLYDFADMLELVLKHRLRPPVKHMFTDESQDMTPAQWRVVDMWKEEADRLFICHDVNQSIFGFSGAVPTELLRRPGHQMYLHHSYRLPSKVHAEAMRIIDRVPLADRAPGDFEPHYEGGSVDRLFGWADAPEGGLTLAQRIVQSEGSWFLLVRNRVFADHARSILIDAGIAFTDRTSSAGVPSPASPRGHAIGVAMELHAGQVVRAGRLRLLIRQVYPGQWDTDKTVWGRSYSLVDLNQTGASERLVREIVKDPLEAIRMEPYERRYLKQILKRHGATALTEPPRVTISTVHSVKGEESTHVAASLAMTRRTYAEYQDNPDDEHRVAYVAATRAKQSLTWIIDGNGYRL